MKSEQTFYVRKPFSKVVPFMRNVKKYFRAGPATDENVAHAY